MSRSPHLLMAVALAVGTLFPQAARADEPWSQWNNTVQCPMARHDWMAVAQSSPGFGWEAAIGSKTSATQADAFAHLDVLRLGDNFRNQCCPVKVWTKNEAGTVTSIIVPSDQNGPGGFIVDSGDMCCEDAALKIGSDPMICTVVQLTSVPSTVIITTTGPQSASTSITIPDDPPVTLLALAPPASGAATVEPDTDRPGLDYTSFDLPAADPAQCMQVCNAQSECRAYSYVKPGVQGPSARCWLKSSASPPISDTCCVSGTRNP